MAKEGIALLSLYNDEDDDEDDLEDERDSPRFTAPREDGSADVGPSGGAEEHVAESTPQDTRPPSPLSQYRTPIVSDDDVYYKSLRSPTPPPLSLPSLGPSVSNAPSRPSFPVSNYFEERRAARGSLAIVDYGHDEVAMSPETEDGEIGGSNSVGLGVELRMSVGHIEDTTLAGTVHILATQSASHLPSDIHDLSKHAAVSVIETRETLSEGDSGLVKTVDTVEMEIDSDPLSKFLPPPVSIKCSVELQEKINKFLAYKRSGKSYNAEVRKKKDYRNPDFLQHAVSYQNIDQLGSCFSKDVFDPHGYDKSDYYDEIEADMKLEMEKKEQERKKSQKVDFISGGTQPAAVVPTLKISNNQIAVVSTTSISAAAAVTLQTASEAVDNLARDVKQNKKSKWDKVEGDLRNPLPSGGSDSLSTASIHAVHLSAVNAGGGYTAFAQQKRREAAEDKKSGERKFERRS